MSPEQRDAVRTLMESVQVDNTRTVVKSVIIRRTKFVDIFGATHSAFQTTTKVEEHETIVID